MLPLEYVEKTLISQIIELTHLLNNDYKNKETNERIKFLREHTIKNSWDCFREGRFIVDYIYNDLEIDERTYITDEYVYLLRCKYNGKLEWENVYLDLIEHIIWSDKCEDYPLLDKNYLIQLSGNKIISWIGNNIVERFAKEQNRTMFYLSILFYKKDTRAISFANQILTAMIEKEIDVSKTALSNLLFYISQSNIWNVYYPTRESAMKAYAYVGKTSIGLSWEYLCLDIIKEVYKDEKIVYQKRLPNKAVLDIGILDKNNNFKVIYECKKSTYFMDYSTGFFADSDNIKDYIPYASKVKVLLLEEPNFRIGKLDYDIITSKQIQAKRKVSKELKSRIKDLRNQCEQQKEDRRFHQREFVIDYSKIPQTDIDKTYALADSIIKEIIKEEKREKRNAIRRYNYRKGY